MKNIIKKFNRWYDTLSDQSQLLVFLLLIIPGIVLFYVVFPLGTLVGLAYIVFITWVRIQG